MLTYGRCIRGTRQTRWMTHFRRWIMPTQRESAVCGDLKLLRLAERPSNNATGSFPAKAPMVTIQSEYSLLNRQIEHEVLPCITELGVGLQGLVAAWTRRFNR